MRGRPRADAPGMRTPLCDVLGIDVPVICAPFGPWDSVDLAAAVCAAGGLGSLGTAVRPVPELRGPVARLRHRTDRPFAINHQMRPFDEAAFAATLAARPAAISYHMGDPGELVARAHDAGIRWIQQVMDVDQAREAVRRGVDVSSRRAARPAATAASSARWPGPPGRGHRGDIPVVAAGGIADGRGLAAALALGAQGVAWVPVSSPRPRCGSTGWKQMLVDAASRDDGPRATVLDRGAAALQPPA